MSELLHVYNCVEELLTAVEVDGLVGAQAWLTTRGLVWNAAVRSQWRE